VKKIVLVLGMPRSGTSLVCQALALLGYEFGFPIIPADQANPWGYYEHHGLMVAVTNLVHECCSPATWLTDGTLVLDRDASHWRENIVRELKEQTDHHPKFVWKNPYISRLGDFFEGVFSELELEPVYIHALREPDMVYESILEANQTHHKHSSENYRLALGTWAHMLVEAKALIPSHTIWFEQWWEEGAQSVVDGLAHALGCPTHDATGLVKEK